MNDRRTSLVAVAALLVLLIAAIALAPPADAGEGMERLCFACRDESNFIWGADLAFYTDERGTQTLRVDGGTGNIDAEGTLDLAGAMTVGGAVTFSGAAVFDGAVAMNSTLDVGGNVASDTGAFTVTDNVMIDGAADAIQLTVQGYTTQTNSLLVLETSAGTDKFTVDNDGNLVVVGASNLLGDVADSGGTFTVADDLLINGWADAVQLTVQGYTTQTSSLLVLEQSDGTDKLTVSNLGALWAAGGADVDGAALYLGADQGIYMDEAVDGDYRFVMGAGTDVISFTVGNVAIGNGIPGVAQDGEDLYVEGTLEVDGEAQLDGALDANSTADFAGAVAFNADTTMAAEATGGNAGARNEYIGLPRIKLTGVGVVDGSGEVEVDDSPDGEWSAINVSTTLTVDTSYYKVGGNSLKVAFAANAVAGNGATSATPNGDWTGMKSIGFWVYADKAFTAAQLVLYLTDATDPATFNTCAYAAPNVWQYCEVDVTSLDGTSGDAVTDIDIRMAAGLPVPINVYVDNMVVWAPADEVSLGVTLQQDGDLGFINALTGASLSPSTDYTIAWRSGVDSIVIVADLDPDGAFGLVAY